MRETRRVEVARTRVYGDVCEVYAGPNCGKADVTQPTSRVSNGLLVHETDEWTYHCSLIISRKSRWYTIRSNTDPSARPSCLLKVAENPRMGIRCEGAGSSSVPSVSSGLRIAASKRDSIRRYLVNRMRLSRELRTRETYDGAAAWCASSTIIAFNCAGSNFSSRAGRRSV